MLRCLQCDETYTAQNENECPSCHWQPSTIDGFIAYTPELAHENDGFSVEAFAFLEKVEESNFWFRARNIILISLLKRYCGTMQSFMEIGCGTGYVLKAVREAFPNIEITGSEIYTKGLSYALERLGNKANLLQLDARNLPFTEEFDVIGAFDVLEHIPEDTVVLAEICRALKPGGHVLLTVPQHMALWSEQDTEAFHVRRYSRKELQQKVKDAGLINMRSTSFVSLLLPAMYLARRKQNTSSGLQLPKLLNAMFYGIMRCEAFGIKCGINFPLGGSRLVLAQKK